jgi:hypothetical protein
MANARRPTLKDQRCGFAGSREGEAALSRPEARAKARVLALGLLLFAGALRAEGFALVTAQRVAPIVVAAGEPEFVRLAAEDLASDVQKITGRKPEVLAGGAACAGACVCIGTKAGGAWESYRVEAAGDRLSIEGGDARGTMFGVYAFIERYLKVDPLGYWSGREPKKQAELKWDAVSLLSAAPTFKFRGWFINDEDLLTFWKPGGQRELPYKFYSNVMHRATLQAVAESIVRSGYNLVIPASFIDILNPGEEALVEACARRGLFLSMHHQEPLGVSAWTFFNYWKARGRDLKYSYVSQPEEVREVWRVYAKKWAEYPAVVWQLGLRGKGDRPMWQADERTPQSDAERGRIISEAMAAQVRILDEVCPRQPRHMSATLWAEGAVLNQKGLLTVPEGAVIVFADNSPGWKWQRDFYETPRNPKNAYGVYYHHALIGCGPHLAQAVSPHRTYALLSEAVQKGAGEYVMLNVSNVREFVLGIGATAEMTWRMAAFDPDAWLDRWVGERFSARQAEIANAYRVFFNAYQQHDAQKVPFLLDGQILAAVARELKALGEDLRASRIGSGAAAERVAYGASAKPASRQADAFWEGLSDMHPQALERRETVKRAAMQQQGFDWAVLHARAAEHKLPADEARFLRDNLSYPAWLMSRLSAWAGQVLLAREALDAGDVQGCARMLDAAAEALGSVGPQAEAYCDGKWREWYKGCIILNVEANLQRTREVATLAKRAGAAR